MNTHVDKLLLLRAVLACMSSLTIADRLCAVQPDDSNVALAIVKRASLLTSGHMKYRIATRQFPDLPIIVEYWFDGSKWLTQNHFGAIEAEDGQKNIRYDPKNFDPSNQKNTPKWIINKAMGRKTSVIPPSFAGSFWSDSALEYVKSHATQAALLGKKTVNGVDCLLLEWKVNPTDADLAFDPVGPELKNGGILRVYAAPKLGFVLPRVECVALNGQIVNLLNAHDFFAVGPDIYIPKKMRLDFFSYEYFLDYIITDVDHVNKPIHASKLEPVISKNAILLDERNQKSPAVSLGTVTPSKHTKPVQGGEDSSLAPAGNPNRLWVVFVVILVLVGFCLLLFWFYKQGFVSKYHQDKRASEDI